MTTIERVIKVTADTKNEYEQKLNNEIEQLKKRDLNYHVTESRYNGINGFIAEIVYDFEIEQSYWEYYC